MQTYSINEISNLNPNPISACSISPCGNYLAFNSDPATLKIVSLAEYRYEPMTNDDVDLNHVLPCLFENRLSSTIRCLDFGRGDVRKNRLPHRSNKRRITYPDIHNACLLAVGLKSGEIKVYSLIPSTLFDGTQSLIENGGNAKIILHDHYEDMSTVVFSTDGSLRLASSSIDGKMRLWDMWDDGNMYQLIRTQNFRPLGCAWGNMCKHICIVGAMGKGFVYQSEKPCVQIASLSGSHLHDISACRYSSDESLLATCSLDTSVVMWCAATYVPLLQIWQTGSKPSLLLMGGQQTVNIRDLEISLDCLNMVTVSDDKIIRIWSLEDAANVAEQFKVTFPGRKQLMTCIRSLPDGRKYVVGTNDGRLLFFDGVQGPPTLAIICRKSIRKILVNKLQSFLNPEMSNQMNTVSPVIEVQPMSLLEMHCSLADIRRRSMSHVFDMKLFKKSVTLASLVNELPIPRMLMSYILYGLHGANVVQNFEPRPLAGYHKERNMSVF